MGTVTPKFLYGICFIFFLMIIVVCTIMPFKEVGKYENYNCTVEEYYILPFQNKTIEHRNIDLYNIDYHSGQGSRRRIGYYNNNVFLSPYLFELTAEKDLKNLREHKTVTKYNFCLFFILLICSFFIYFAKISVQNL